MKYSRSDHFKRAYQLLPNEIKRNLRKSLLLLQDNPKHPDFLIAKVNGYPGVWEGTVDQDYRFTFHFENDETDHDTICVLRFVDSQEACMKHE